MTLEELSTVLCCNLHIEYADVNGNYMARLENAEEMRNGCLASLVGRGKTPDMALSSLIDDLKGKKIAIDATSENRREFRIPMTLNEIR